MKCEFCVARHKRVHLVEILTIYIIDRYIVANLLVGLRGKECSKELMREVVELILSRLRGGWQWR
jgi:hypothetical protein